MTAAMDAPSSRLRGGPRFGRFDVLSVVPRLEAPFEAISAVERDLQ